MKQTRNKNNKNTVRCQNLAFSNKIKYANCQLLEGSRKMKLIENQKYIKNDK